MNKINFNFNKHKDKKEVVHCKTEEEAGKWCQYMHNNGLTWRNGVSYLKYTCWDVYKEDTCYLFNEGYIDGVQCAVKDGYTVIEFSSLLNSKRVKL